MPLPTPSLKTYSARQGLLYLHNEQMIDKYWINTIMGPTKYGYGIVIIEKHNSSCNCVILNVKRQSLGGIPLSRWNANLGGMPISVECQSLGGFSV